MRGDERASERAREKGRNREKKGGGEQGPRESKDEAAAATRRRGDEEGRTDVEGLCGYEGRTRIRHGGMGALRERVSSIWLAN